MFFTAISVPKCHYSFWASGTSAAHEHLPLFIAFPHTDLVHRIATHVGQSQCSHRFPSGYVPVTVVPRLLAHSGAEARM